LTTCFDLYRVIFRSYILGRLLVCNISDILMLYTI